MDETATYGEWTSNFTTTVQSMTTAFNAAAMTAAEVIAGTSTFHMPTFDPLRYLTSGAMALQLDTHTVYFLHSDTEDEHYRIRFNNPTTSRSQLLCVTEEDLAHVVKYLEERECPVQWFHVPCKFQDPTSEVELSFDG
jgi:hypothetical protein